MGEMERNSWFRVIFQEDRDAAEIKTMDDIAVTENWRQVIKACLPNAGYDNKYLKISRRKCLYLYGPAGTGKHRMAMALAGTLYTQGNFVCFAARRTRINRASQTEMEEWIEELLDMAAENAIFLLIENPSSCEKGALFLDILMEELEVMGEDVNLVLAVCEKDLSLFRPEWQDIFVPCKFDIPDKKTRTAYLRDANRREARTSDGRTLIKQRVPFTRDLSYEFIADQTEKFSYSNLKQLMDILKLQTKQKGIEQYGTVNEMNKAVQDGTFYCDSDQVMEAIRKVKAELEDAAVKITAAGNENTNANMNTDIMKSLVSALQQNPSNNNANTLDGDFADEDNDLNFDDFQDFDDSDWRKGNKKRDKLGQSDFDYLDN